ncbi:MAG: hypothetical protein V7637_6486 [Mycobacteriales bacterium]
MPGGWRPSATGRGAEQSGLPVGLLPLRPLSFGEILGGAGGIFRRSPGPVLAVALLLVTLQQVALVVSVLLLQGVPTDVGFAPGFDLSAVSGLSAVLGLFVSTLVGAVLTAMIVVLVTEDMLGQRLGLGELWGRVRSRLVAVIAVSLLTTVLSTLGLVLLLVPGAMLWAGWALVVPALMVERLGPIKAMRRSWQLAWPDVLRVFAVRLVGFLFGLFLFYIVALPFELLGFVATDDSGTTADNQGSLLVLMLAAVGSLLGGILMRPFLAAVLALLYLDRRMRAEGMDVVLNLQFRQRRYPPAVPPDQPARSDLPALTDPGLGRWAGPVPVSGGPPPAAGTP